MYFLMRAFIEEIIVHQGRIKFGSSRVDRRGHATQVANDMVERQRPMQCRFGKAFIYEVKHYNGITHNKHIHIVHQTSNCGLISPILNYSLG